MDTSTPLIQQIGQMFSQSPRILILSHEEPEGDCLGSALALGRSLTQVGHQVCLYNAHPVPRAYRFLRGSELFTRELPPDTPDLVVVVDCGNLERVGRAAVEAVAGLPLVNIDHHVSNKGFGTLNLIDPAASSTGELIHRILKALGLPFDVAIWEALLCAIVTDTGSFRYSNTSAQALQVASEAVAGGASPWFVAEGMFERHRPNRVRALALALEGIELGAGGRWALMPLPLSLFERTGATRDETEGFINYARGIEGVEVAILVREDAPDHQKISLRSKGRVDVSRVAARLGGGGHRNAAACRIAGDLAYARGLLVGAVEDALRAEGLL